MKYFLFQLQCHYLIQHLTYLLWLKYYRKGIPSLKELVKSGDLGIKSANKIVNFSEEEQEKAVQEIEQRILTKDKNKPKEDTKVTIQDIIDNISTLVLPKTH